MHQRRLQSLYRSSKNKIHTETSQMQLKISGRMLKAPPSRTLLLHILHLAQVDFLSELNRQSAEPVHEEEVGEDDAHLDDAHLDDAHESTNVDEGDDEDSHSPKTGKGKGTSRRRRSHPPDDLAIDLTTLNLTHRTSTFTSPRLEKASSFANSGGAKVLVHDTIFRSNATYVSLLYSYLLSLVSPDPFTGGARVRSAAIPLPRVTTSGIRFRTRDDKDSYIQRQKDEFLSLAKFALRPFIALSTIDEEVDNVNYNDPDSTADIGPDAIVLDDAIYSAAPYRLGERTDSDGWASMMPHTPGGRPPIFLLPTKTLLQEANVWFGRSEKWFKSNVGTDQKPDPVVKIRRVQVKETTGRDMPRRGWVLPGEPKDDDDLSSAGDGSDSDATDSDDDDEEEEDDQDDEAEPEQEEFVAEATFTRSDIIAAIHFLVKSISRVKVGDNLELGPKSCVSEGDESVEGETFGLDGYGMLNRVYDADDEEPAAGDSFWGPMIVPKKREDPEPRWRQQKDLLFRLMHKLLPSSHE